MLADCRQASVFPLPRSVQLRTAMRGSDRLTEIVPADDEGDIGVIDVGAIAGGRSGSELAVALSSSRAAPVRAPEFEVPDREGLR